MRRALLLAAGLVLALPGVASADTVVTTFADGNDGECAVDCTLREALATSPTNDTIVLPTGGLQLATPVDVAGTRTIRGTGARTTSITSTSLDQLVTVTSGSPTIEGVELIGAAVDGLNGGAVSVAAGQSLTLRDSHLTGNSADNGGGIYAAGTVIVERSAFIGNNAANGDGIYVAATGTAELRNTTITGGGLYTLGTLTLRNVTMVGNPDVGVERGASGTVTLVNTLVADSGGDNCAGPGFFAQTSMADDGTCADSQVILAPAVDGLGDYGGPTDVFRTIPGSPLIDAGTSCEAADQRGLARTQGPCDVGAYESAAALSPTLTADQDGVCDAGCSLREALDYAAENATVTLPQGDYELSLGQIVIDDWVTIRGLDWLRTSISGEGGNRVLEIADGTTVLERLGVWNGVNEGGLGGGVYVQSNGGLIVRDSQIHNNSAGTGGGIYNLGTVTVERSVIHDNSAEDIPAAKGAGIANHATATLTNATVAGNDADDGGGGIYNVGVLTLRNVTLAQNASLPPAPEGSALETAVAATTNVHNTLIANNLPEGSCRLAATVSWTSSLSVPADGTCGTAEAASAGIGFLTDNGGLTETYALLAGSPAIDAGGAPCPATDQRGVARTGTCDIGAFEVASSPPPPPPPDDEQPPLPPADEEPVAGESVDAQPSGTVKVKLPGTSRFVTLADDGLLPVGTVVDTLKGRVALTAAGGQTAVFYDGVFRITQGKGTKPLTVLTLVETLSCKAATKAVAAAKGKKKRRLWGDGKGRFQVKGKHSAATVVGTKWLVEDTCTTTLTRVVRGRVSVRDFVKKKTVVVKAGKSYTARARKR